MGDLPDFIDTTNMTLEDVHLIVERFNLPLVEVFEVAAP